MEIRRRQMLKTGFVRNEIRNLRSVEHGGDAWRYRYMKSFKGEIVDFSSNVNPLGTSPQVLSVVRKNLHLIQLLPDTDSAFVKEATAEYLNDIVNPANIIVGNGSTELIHLFALTFVSKGEECIIPIPTFGEYEIAVIKAGGQPRFVTLKAKNNFTLSLGEVLKNVKPRSTKAIFICNPNNPTGQMTSKQGLIKFLNEAADMGVMVFLDESYIEFTDGGTSLTGFVKEYPNLFVLRSLTKTFGLMGLRIGYGVASKEVIEFMSKARISWNVNVLAQVAAVAALKDRVYLEKAKKIVCKERGFLFRGLRKVKGFHVLPTKANFFLIDVKGSGFNAPRLKEEMLMHGILIRDCSTIRGLNHHYLRISIKRHQENKKFLNILTSVVGERA